MQERRPSRRTEFFTRASHTCRAASDRYPPSMDGDYSPQQVAELLKSGTIQLVDVRERHEHQAGRIGAGLHIQLGELSARAEELGREVPVVFYCRSGARSAMATQAFQAAGYDAHNMAGGILAWHGDGLPIEPSGGFIDEP